MSKKGGGAGDGKITPKNPSLRMRPRGGFWGGGGGGGKSWFWGILGIQGCWGCCGLPQEVASKLDSVKTDLIAVERNLVSGNKFYIKIK